MEGVLFYWFSWLAWVWTTFILHKKHDTRIELSIWILLLIIFSPYQLHVVGIEVSVSALVLILFFITRTAKLSRKEFYSVFLSSFIIMIGYVSFLLFELFDPVWVMFDRKWMIAIGGILLSSVLQEKLYHRVYALVSGMLLGEILFSVIMQSLSFMYVVATLAFMDIFAVTLMVMAVWGGFNYLTQVIGNYINYGRGKQKSS